MGALTVQTAFFASIAALPVNDMFGIGAPFLVSVALGVVSLVAALVYLRFDEVATSSGDVDHTRLIPLAELVRLGDAVSCYYLVCALSGALWFPTVHLAPDMLRTLFEITPQRAATIGSVGASSLTAELTGSTRYTTRPVPRSRPPA